MEVQVRNEAFPRRLNPQGFSIGLSEITALVYPRIKYLEVGFLTLISKNIGEPSFFVYLMKQLLNFE